MLGDKIAPNNNFMVGILLAEKALLKSPYVKRFLMNNLKLAVVFVFLIVLSSLSREISNPAPTDIELSYQRQYQELNQKGYLTETDIQHLDELKEQYLHSNERADKM
ncbi:hypothetical protein [Neptunicella sp. SCSIO 80796]|uniref:hypothetical protein n=1 Tax=Neptunicella plasticusilytica TaxID=3117012 RepID=UPI003A4E3A17